MNIKAVVFDADGVVINSPGYFSDQYEKDFGVSGDVMLPFFKGRFQDCLVGKADLKEELKPLLESWQWNGSIDELLDYWFKAEHYIDERIVAEIEKLQKMGVKCYLGTRQEKYRNEYIKNEMGFGKIFDGIYSSADMGCKKPEREFFEVVATDLEKKEGIKSEETVFWDDDEFNVAAAKDFGWRAYFYSNFDDFYKTMSQL